MLDKILSKLPLLSRDKDDEEEFLSDEEVRHNRIVFHRTHVRNGPSGHVFGAVNARAQKRAQVATAKRRVKRARRSQLRDYHESQRIAAVVRGHLQLAGVLPYVVERELDPRQQVISASWLVQRFGTTVEEDGREIVSFKYEDVLTALGEALHFYGQVVGLPDLQVPAGYVVPIYEVASA